MFFTDMKTAMKNDQAEVTHSSNNHSQDKNQQVRHLDTVVDGTITTETQYLLAQSQWAMTVMGLTTVSIE